MLIHYEPKQHAMLAAVTGPVGEDALRYLIQLAISHYAEYPKDGIRPLLILIAEQPEIDKLTPFLFADAAGVPDRRHDCIYVDIGDCIVQLRPAVRVDNFEPPSPAEAVNPHTP